MAGRDVNNFRKHYAKGQGNLRVLLDMDQVLCDFEGAFLESFREKFPDEPCIELADRRTFYLNDQYGELYPGIQVRYSRLLHCTSKQISNRNH